MEKQDDRPPIVVALESQDLVGLKRLLYREDTRLDHVVDDSCTAGAATYKTLFSVGMAGASGGWKSSRSFCQVLEIYIFQTLYLPFILLYMYSYGIKE